MSILKRMRDMTVATLNDKLERSEDPVRLIDNYLARQREQIRESEKLHSQCFGHAQSLRQQYLTALETKNKREQQALVALKAGEEEVARLALQEKITNEEKSVQYGALYEECKAQLLELEAQLKELKAEYTEVAAKRSYYQARMETVRLQQRMNERMAGAGAAGTPGMFNRLEDKVSAWELEARSLRDVRRMTREAAYEAGSALQSALEVELNKLRQKLEKES
ncbi:PspA/IM30 family protein [Paenibacillus aurantius]|uniref:PspA/IM30 family protein n=1 Tax=Paenibacillus aurantius TaxID=2918900 RepID=A0AA96LI12_9BACL|nr:PspA/IM30 family protein [Paenibacillus aurantius]WJH37171.1 PspA/IM30 family protein [Paenibacillus sp. CC-CFT747]WNQ12485.1 PspA/IM30 family protein [Paenibacillus aurantius]